MEETMLTPEKAMIGLTILSAIPIVIFALWVDYVERTINIMKTQKEELHPEEEIRNVRFSSLWILCIEAIFFFGSPVAKKGYPGLSLFVFFTALFALNQVIVNFEKKIIPETPSRTEHYKQGIQSLFWVFACTFVQLITAYTIVGTSLYIATRPGTPPIIGALTVFFGTLGGVLAGIVSNFLIAPFYLKKTFANKNLNAHPDYQTNSEIVDSMLKRHGLTNVETKLILESKSIFGPAFVSGLNFGKKWFKPTLFISEDICKSLNRTEFQAVISHELAHLKFKHLEKRLLFSLLTFSVSLIVSVLILTLSVKFLPFYLQAPIRILSFAFLLGGPVMQFFSLSKKQEIEADELAITHFKSDPSSLSSALLKLQGTNKKESPSKINTTHPSLYERIQKIEVLNAKIKYGTFGKTEDTKEKAA